MFIKCALSYWFGHIQKVSSKTDYPRLLGIVEHRFIKGMYASKNNPLYYTDLTSARGAWFWNWYNALEKNLDRIKFPDKEQEKIYGGIGWSCIEKYWNKNLKNPRPIEIEKPYEMQIHGTYKLVGTIDQIRNISLEGIAKIRPELITNGQLDENYDPVVIVDLKTGSESWDLTDYVPGASPLQIAAHQFALHDDLQVTAYWQMYHKTHKKMPVGFYLYQLRSGKSFLTIRTEKDYPILLETLNSVISGIEKEEFPMNIGNHCEYCDFFEACIAIRNNRPLYVSKPSDGITNEEMGNIEIQPEIKVEKAQQMRFKFNTPTLVRKNVSKKQTKKTKLLKTATVVTLPSYEDDFKEDKEKD